MLYTVKAIVLRVTKYSESSLVVKAYTNLFGLRTYMVRGVKRRSKSGVSAALFQPLSLLDMQVYEKNNRDIQHVKEVKLAYHYTSIPFKIEKSSLLVFLNEVMYKSVKEEVANESLFHFLYNSCVELDTTTASVALFHIRFMLELSRYLGFFPDNNYHSHHRPFFDMLEGVFVPLPPPEKYTIAPPVSVVFSELLMATATDKPLPNVAKPQRQELLQKCIAFYSCHVPQFKDIKSLEVLQAVME